MATKLEPIVAYVSPDEKRRIVKEASGDTLSNYLRSKLCLEPLKRGRQSTKPAPDGDDTLANAKERERIDRDLDYGSRKGRPFGDGSGATGRAVETSPNTFKVTPRASGFARTIRQKGDDKR